MPLKLSKPETDIRCRPFYRDNRFWISFSLALFIRLAFLAQYTEHVWFAIPPVDTEQFEWIASLWSGGDFSDPRTNHISPLYPVFLTILSFVFEQDRVAIVLVQALLDALTAGILYLIGRRLFSPAVGLGAAILYACYEVAILFSGMLLPTTLVTLLALLSLYAFVSGQDLPAPSQESEGKKPAQAKLCLLSGLLLGLAIMGRPNLVIWAGFATIWLLASRDKGKRRAFAFASGCGAVLLALALKNAMLFGSLSPFSSQGGLNFYIGNHPEALGVYTEIENVSNSPLEQVETSIAYAERETGNRLSPAAASRFWLKKGASYLTANPSDALQLYARKTLLFWRVEEATLNVPLHPARRDVPILRIPWIRFGWIAPFALLGIGYCLLSREPARRTPALFAIAYAASVILFFVSTRYRLPIGPVLALLAACAIARTIGLFQARRWQPLAGALAASAALAIAVNYPIKSFAAFDEIRPREEYNLGVGHVGRHWQNVAEAQAAFERAIEGESHPDSRMALGLVLADEGLYLDALEVWAENIRFHPDHEPTKAHFKQTLQFITTPLRHPSIDAERLRQILRDYGYQSAAEKVTELERRQSF